MIKIQTKKSLDEIAKIFLFMAKSSDYGNVVKRLVSKKTHAPKQQRKFWIFLEENLDGILIGDPYKLQAIAEEIDKDFNYASSHAKASSSKLAKSLVSIFNYDVFTRKDGYKGWNAYWLAQQLSVDTCPYCNRLYTNTVSNDKQSISRPQFDHFIDKSTYPYLAISFYNLVPSCAVCNTTLKRTIKFNANTHIHPYLEGFGDLVKFKLEIQDSSFFSGNTQSGKIRFKNKTTTALSEQNHIKRAEQNIKVFKLTEMYEQHIDYVQEQVHRALVYNPDYLDSLFQQFEGSLFRNREDLIRFVAANYVGEENQSARPLSKLTRDIAEQFGLWNDL